MLCHSGNTSKPAITKIVFNLVKPLLRDIEKTMVISDLEHLENCESSYITGGFFDFGGGNSSTSNTNTASFSTIFTSALGILAPATSLNNILVTQVNGSASASLL
jgi:hypothetical protein